MEELPDLRHPDAGVATIIDWFKSQTNYVERLGQVIRQSLDDVIDGARTGRYKVDELVKTEKTYIGTKVEILIGYEFELQRGGPKAMDYVISGLPVDCKWTINTTWMIPREAVNHICLLIKANDSKSTFDVAVARMAIDVLTTGKNGDNKRSISSRMLEDSGWIVRNGPLPINLLLQLDSKNRDAIFGMKSGQARVTELFRRLQGELIDRNVVSTVAKQIDSAKRVRDARLTLDAEGIRIFGHQEADRIAVKKLGLPIPSKGQWVSSRCHE